MAQAAQQMPNYTIAEFDRIVEGDLRELDYKLIDGEIVLMSNPTRPMSRLLPISAHR